MEDVSSRFQQNEYDSIIARNLVKLQETPEAIQCFFKVCDKLTDYSYWFLLSVLWVSYTGFSDLNLWKKLFDAKRKYKTECIMKPSELKEFNKLPNNIKVFRVHRTGEKDWIAYTLDFEVAKRFARDREVNTITEYRLKRKDITALFLRRGEHEIIMTDKSKARLFQEHYVD